MEKNMMKFGSYCLVAVILTLFIVTPSLSAPGDIKNPSEKGVLDQQDKKDVSGASVVNSGKKSGTKKIVKKAGSAAAAGVAGKKITSGVKGNKEDD